MRSQYEVERMKYSDLEGSVVVPTYQTRLVWSEKQKENFIENISKGYPFGSILLYRYEGEKKLSLIDGLQRYSTLREYKQDPAKYFKDFDPYINKILANIEAGMGASLSIDARDTLSLQIETILRGCLEEKDPSMFFLRSSVNEKLSPYPNGQQYQDDLVQIQDDLRRNANSYLNLDDLVIPCVIFTGEEDQLPDVFANLNQGGTKLSKYQVLAAHWTKHDFRVSSKDWGQRILRKVIDRYARLEEKRELRIEDFDPDEIEQSRTINLSEYCFALGELIAEETPVFWKSASSSDSDRGEDTYNVVGYLSTAIALGVDNRTINKLPEHKDLFQSEEFVDLLTEYIIKEYRVIQREFEKWLRKPGLDSGYESGAITDMQVLSFFAALWHKHYIIDKEKKLPRPIEHYKNKGYDATRKNLVAYCIADAISKTWQGSGDTRLANFYAEKTDALHSYVVPMSRESLTNKLITWYEDASQRGSVNVEKNSKMLLCVYSAPDATKYTAEKYDIEHVISKEKLKKGNAYINEQIPGGMLGNLIYLSSKTNRGKKQFNLYILQNNHEGVSFEDEYLKMLCYPLKETIFKAEEQLDDGKANATKELLNSRAKEMIARIAKAVCG